MENPASVLSEIRKRTESGFLGFWIRQYRISYLIVLGIIAMGIIALVNIPKESSPSIEFGIIAVTISYPGANPVDIDTLITSKVYKELKDISGIETIDSQSSLGISSTSITLKTDTSVKDVLSDIRTSIARISLPTEANTPVITEIKTDTHRAFSVYIYSKEPTSVAFLREKAQSLATEVEKAPGINAVDFDGGNDYSIEIILDKDKLLALGLSIDTIGTTIRSWNRNMPLGSFEIGERKYDYRIEGKHLDAREFLGIPLSLPSGDSIVLGDISTLSRRYKDESEKRIFPTECGSGAYVALNIDKTASANIFSASDAAKKVIETIFSKEEYKKLGFVYGMDLADTIRSDYRDLVKEALTTLVLVFFAMFLFVGFRDSLFATLTLPLAFLATFMGLYYGGFTLNFLTNFSLILSFGIAVDTIIVIVQAASAKIRVGYEPRSAIMLALHEYAIPIISGVSTTIVVFIPMMTLPGILGKFLAYIPITIFFVLAFGLVLALTVNSALYLLFIKGRKTYVEDANAMEYATEEEKTLLTLERKSKTQVEAASIPFRIRMIHSMTSWYKSVLRSFLEHTYLRRISIFLPLVLLILSFIFLAPVIGFNLFPGGDGGMISFRIEGTSGETTGSMYARIKNIGENFKGFPEISYTTLVVKENVASLGIQLTKTHERELLGQRTVFELEPFFLEKLEPLTENGLKVTSEIAVGGPPSEKAIGLKLITENAENLERLIQVSHDFEAHLKTIPGIKNSGTSSKSTPGEFVFTLKRDLLSQYGISPAQIYNQIYQSLNGQTVGSIEDSGEDIDIVIRQSNFLQKIVMEDILAIEFGVGETRYHLGEFVDYKAKNAVASLSRKDGKLQITVDADLEKGVDSVSTQAQFLTFAKTYKFPTGISYESGGENEANKELIVAVLSAFFIAVLAILAILTLQFNSFSQPAIILYSVIMSLPFVMLGLLLTGNQFSLPFGIGFIAFTGIAVNHGIILIDAINQNLKKGMEGITALVEAGSSRLEPMLLTTLTTVLGIFPIALKDIFWAGMGYTIIFGIIAASGLTLFVVKGIYYELYLKPKRKKRTA